MDIILEAFSVFLSIENLLVVGIGVSIGAVVGAIPGMTTPMGVALVLPFTFSLPPVTGILLLLGVYKGGLYGGSLTAILIKTPGTPAATCTVLDGYPLTRKGQARKALDIALYSSCVADLISNLSLILFAGVLASFALRFGPPEFFTLIVFSLTIIAGVSGHSLAKGVLSGLPRPDACDRWSRSRVRNRTFHLRQLPAEWRGSTSFPFSSACLPCRKSSIVLPAGHDPPEHDGRSLAVAPASASSGAC